MYCPHLLLLNVLKIQGTFPSGSCICICVLWAMNYPWQGALQTPFGAAALAASQQPRCRDVGAAGAAVGGGVGRSSTRCLGEQQHRACSAGQRHRVPPSLARPPPGSLRSSGSSGAARAACSRAAVPGASRCGAAGVCSVGLQPLTSHAGAAGAQIQPWPLQRSRFPRACGPGHAAPCPAFTGQRIAIKFQLLKTEPLKTSSKKLCLLGNGDKSLLQEG